MYPGLILLPLYLRLDQAQFGQFAIKFGRQFTKPARVIDTLRRVCIGQIAPALMRTLRLRMHAFQLGGADDIDAPVIAIVEPQYLDPPDQRVLHDKVELAADQFVGALGFEPRRETNFAALCIVCDPRLKRRIVGAADGDAGHVKRGHERQMGSR